MSKLRITPKNKGSFNDNDEKKENIVATPSSNIQTKSIDYFLNKNVEDFTEETLKNFEIACQSHYQTFIETTNKINKKLFLLNKINLHNTNNTETVETAKQEKDTINKLPTTFSELTSLIQEIVEDSSNENALFLKDLLYGLIQIDQKIENNEPMLNNVYDALSELLQKLESYTIFQQKYIYRSIANCINQKYTAYHLISPEDGNFVDPKFHRIISGNGQRIVRGLSFILTDKNSDEVLKFGNIRTI